MPTQAVQTLMTNLVDYAGLFPPAKLPMDKAVENYARYVACDEAWMLGRFIVPVGRLDEFEKSAATFLPREAGSEPWHVSAIIDGDLDACIDTIFAFNDRHEDPTVGLVLIDTIELKASDPNDVDDALELMPQELYCFFEVPRVPDVRGFITALAGNDSAAKIRTGGVTPDGIPDSAFVGAFLHACAAANVPFKATAGLHHPIRAEHNLTYEDRSPRAVMHGFLNMFLGAALVREHGISPAEVARLLDVTDAGAFRLDETTAGIGGETLEVAKLARWRESFALSYGSCSFDEPIADLRALGHL